MFDNEDEKDQWEEDQKVSSTVLPNFFFIETLTLFFSDVSLFLNLILFYHFAAS